MHMHNARSLSVLRPQEIIGQRLVQRIHRQYRAVDVTSRDLSPGVDDVGRGEAQDLFERFSLCQPRRRDRSSGPYCPGSSGRLFRRRFSFYK
jgi:hypothetical protein